MIKAAALGVVTKISRHEYHRRARIFASKYFLHNYGVNWDLYFAKVLPDDVEERDIFSWHRSVWDKKMPYPWRDKFLWFWKSGSFVKQKILRLKSKPS